MFLNFDKVQKDFLAACLKAAKKRVGCEWFTGHNDDRQETYISNGHFIAIVPDEMCFIQPGTKGRKIDFQTIKKNMPDESLLDALTDTQTSRQIPAQKITCRIFQNKDGEEIWVNEKLLSYFDGMECRFLGSKPTAPIMVYSLGRAVGMVLPISHK